MCNCLFTDLNALPCYKHEIPLTQSTVSENTEETAVSLKNEPDSIQDWSEHRLGQYVLGNTFPQNSRQMIW